MCAARRAKIRTWAGKPTCAVGRTWSIRHTCCCSFIPVSNTRVLSSPGAENLGFDVARFCSSSCAPTSTSRLLRSLLLAPGTRSPWLDSATRGRHSGSARCRAAFTSRLCVDRRATFYVEAVFACIGTRIRSKNGTGLTEVTGNCKRSRRARSVKKTPGGAGTPTEHTWDTHGTELIRAHQGSERRWWTWRSW